MGHSVRTWLALTTAAAVATGASVVLLGTAVAFATDSELTVTAGSPFTVNEGVRASNKLVANFTDNSPNTRPSIPNLELTCSQMAQARYRTTINWGDGSATSGGTVSCNETSFRVKGSHTYADSGTFHISVTVLDTADDATATGTDTATATVTDAGIQGITPSNKTTVEGAGPLKIEAQFTDGNGTFSSTIDAGLTASIAWGDGTSSAGTVKACDCQGNIAVSGSHTYDANKPPTSPYAVTVTLSDDGGSSAADTFTVTVADAALSGTGQPFSATAGSGSSPVVAKITDAAAAQAATADFTASIKWGDNSTSAGTVTKTAAGAFSVSGTHTYAAAGSRTVTITVTDEEGQTLSMTAAATVGAAPVVLPNTGQPKAPVAPTSPLLAFALVLLALASGIGGLIRLRANR